MSKLGRFSLWIILLGLAFIAGLRGYRAYEQRVQQQQEHIGVISQAGLRL